MPDYIYKVGDVVMYQGRLRTISDDEGDGNFWLTGTRKCAGWCVSHHSIELATSKPFLAALQTAKTFFNTLRVGDAVVLLDNSSTSYPVGSIGTVVSFLDEEVARVNFGKRQLIHTQHICKIKTPQQK